METSLSTHVRPAVLALVLTVVASCGRRSATPAAADAGTRSAIDAGGGAGAAGVDAAPEKPAVLEGHPWQVDLFDVTEDGGVVKPKLGVVSVPLGAREPRPIMIALHGGSDRPEWACNEWRGVVNAYPFLVCPRGAGGVENALGWTSLSDTKSRVARAIAATRKLFAAWVRGGTPIVIVGFSMGGTQTALLAQSEPAVYRRVVLVESSYNVGPAIAFARPWARGGGERALFGCTTSGCEGPYRKAALEVSRQERPARLNVAGTRDHGMWDQVVRSLRRDWPWVVEDAPGWEKYEAPVEEGELPGRTERFDPR